MLMSYSPTGLELLLSLSWSSKTGYARVQELLICS